MRIVSLLPSATEIVAALGAAGELVGVSHECDYPDEVRGLPVLTRSRLAAELSSREIDRTVRAALTEALSLYAIDHELLAELAPDLILTQDLCEVCAVSRDDVRSAVARLAGSEQLRIVSLSPTRLEHVLGDIERVGAALGVEREARALRSRLEQRLTAIRERATRAVRARVVTVEWLEPLMLGGTWMPDLIDIAGGIALGTAPGAPAPELGAEALHALEPDVIVFKPCGFTLERALRERELIERIVAKSSRSAARVYLADGSAYFNRSGPRLVESAEILAACVHPELFSDFACAHAKSFVEL